jgi:hypothetical protein
MTAQWSDQRDALSAQEMTMPKVDAATPPPLPIGYGCAYYERTEDPFHVDALPTDMPADTMVVAIGGQFKDGPRQQGWMQIDWYENPIGFIADGEEFTGDPPKYVLRDGPYGKLCAYPEGSEKLKEHEGKDWRRTPTVEAK